MTEATRKKIRLVRRAMRGLRSTTEALETLTPEEETSGVGRQAWDAAEHAEHEFILQWPNVEAILDELAPEEKHEQS